MSDKKIDDCWNKIGVWANSQQRTCPRLSEVVHCANCEIFSLAGKTLLEGEAPAGYLDEWAKQLAAAKVSKNYDSNSVILFRLGDEWLGIETGLLDEVVSIRAIHTIPHRKNSVLKGLTNIRGELQLCISIGRLMNITRGEISGTNVVKGIYERMVVMSFSGVRFVFPVSEVRGVYRFSENALQEAPATAMNCSIHYLKGMLDIEGRHVGIIDHKLLFPALERAIL
jgi:chemotaxis-related protein WspD